MTRRNVVTLETGTAGGEWRVGALSDFDADGNSDVLWQNSSTGEFRIWRMLGMTVENQVILPSLLSNYGWLAGGSWNTITRRTPCPPPDDSGPSLDDTGGSLYVSARDGSDSNSGTSSDSPYKTVQMAQRVVREWIARGLTRNVLVFLDGEFLIDETLLFTGEDSPPDGFSVTWTSYPATTAVLNGGKTVAGPWTRVSDSIWSVDAREYLDENQEVRQLFRNGWRVPMSRFPSYGYADRLRVADMSDDRKEITFADALPSLGTHAELVSIVQWMAPVVRIEGNSGSVVSLVSRATAPPAHDYPVDLQKPPYASLAYIQNLPLEVTPDYGDTWEFDKEHALIRYRSSDGSDPNLGSFVVPVLDELVAARHAQNISFSRLAFSYSRGFQMPAMADGSYLWMNFAGSYLYEPTDLPGQLATFTHYRDYFYEPARFMPAAVVFEDSRNLSLTESSITHAGGTGVWVTSTGDSELTDVVIEGNDISDIGFNCVMIGDNKKLGPKRQRLRLSQNRIHRCGAVSPASVGVLQAYSRDTTISNNEVFDLPYTGIAVGWSWWQKAELPESNKSNRVERNQVFNVCKVLRDCGGIYTVGPNNESTITGNLIHDVEVAPDLIDVPINMGLYLDHATNGISASDNVIYDVQPEYMIWEQNYYAIVDGVVIDLRADNNTFGVNYPGDPDLSNDDDRFRIGVIEAMSGITLRRERSDGMLARSGFYMPLDERSGNVAGVVVDSAAVLQATLSPLGSAPVPRWTGYGRHGAALEFSGNFVKTPLDMTFFADGATTLTMSLWMKPEHWNTNYISILGLGGGAGWEEGFALTTTEGQLAFWVDGYQVAASGPLPATGMWHHVVGCYDGEAIRLFVDGLLQASTPYSGPLGAPPPGCTFQVGRICTGGSAGFSGVIDEVEVTRSPCEW